MTTSPTLMERDPPYQLQVELARGKVNQLRNQAADWLSGGLQMPEALQDDIRDATLAFARAVTDAPSPRAGAEAQTALARAFRAADDLVHVYINQVFQVRHQRQPRLDTALACRLGADATLGRADRISSSKHLTPSTCPFAWSDVQPSESDFQWQAHEDLLAWAQANHLAVVGGPLIDFSPAPPARLALAVGARPAQPG